ncbi:MAG: dihydrofolate reductase [Clostridiales bacterium]|nr:dihydrofolate reductase [Clostridiales bacterium]
MLKLIAAVARDGGIGWRGGLLFSIPEDLRRFKTLTTGKTVVMGRGTLDSLPGGRPLKGRRNLVLTRDRAFCRDGVEAFHSLPELLAALAAEDEAWVIGGAAVYEQLLPCCGALYLTEVDAAPPADRFFPPLDEGWRLAGATDWRETDGLPYRFCRYER